MAETTKKAKKIRLKKGKTATTKRAPRKTASVPTASVTTPQKVEVVILPQPKDDKTKEKKAKTCEISRFFYAIVIMMIIVLYAEIVAGIVVYFNYDVQFNDHVPSLSQTVKHLRQQRKQGLLKKLHHHNIKRRELPKQVLAEKVPVAEIEPKAPILKCPPKAVRKVAFDEAEYAPFAQGGNAKIEGNLCSTLKDKTVKCYENAVVFINPVTSYSDEWYARAWAGRENLEVADSRAFDYNISVRTKTDGSFVFDNLKPGEYYVGAVACVPNTKDSKECYYTRYGTKVKTNDTVRAELQRVYP